MDRCLAFRRYQAAIRGEHSQIIITERRVQTTEERFRTFTKYLGLSENDAFRRIGYELGVKY